MGGTPSRHDEVITDPPDAPSSSTYFGSAAGAGMGMGMGMGVMGVDVDADGDVAVDVDPHNNIDVGAPSPHALDRQPSSSLTNFTTTEFVWNYGGHSVYITGGWDDWREKSPLSRTAPNTFTAVLALPTGTFQYKFIVDGNWKHNPALPTQHDPNGNINNFVVVAPQVLEYDSDPLPGSADDARPRSPIESYNFSIFPQEDHTAEPPALPRMLMLAPLDRDRPRDAARQAARSQDARRPHSGTSSSIGVDAAATAVGADADAAIGTDFVRLNHLFETRAPAAYGRDAAVLTLATESRYKAKVITTVVIASSRPVLAFHPAAHQMHAVPAAHPARCTEPAPASAAPHVDAAPARLDESRALIFDALNNV